MGDSAVDKPLWNSTFGRKSRETPVVDSWLNVASVKGGILMP